MKKILLSSVALIGFTAGAMAADLPARVAPVAPAFTPIPVFTWTGFYVGANAGWGWRDDDDETVVLGPGPGIPAGLVGTLTFPNGDDGGFVGGGQIGYNYQIGSFVIGAEADIQWADTGDDEAAVFVADPLIGGTFVPGVFERNDPDWFGTVRARLGFAFDRVLIYGTGGLAYTEDNTGWVLGAGVEWALPTTLALFGSSAVTFGVEGLWVSIDRDEFRGPIGTFTPVGGVPEPVFFPIDDDESEFGVIRAKLNFKF